MELLYTATSPYARKVRIAILERGLDRRVTPSLVDPLEDAAELHAVAPFGKVPVLVDDRGRSIIDSRVIVTYLDFLDAPGPKLRPEDPEEAFQDQRREAFADGILDCAVPVVMERRRAANERSERFERRQIDKIRRALDVLGTAPPPPPDDGLPPTPGLIATACAVRYLGFRLGDEPDLALPPMLTLLRDVCEQRASFVATAPPAG